MGLEQQEKWDRMTSEKAEGLKPRQKGSKEGEAGLEAKSTQAVQVRVVGAWSWRFLCRIRTCVMVVYNS